MELRAATEADLDAMESVFRAAIGELYERHRLRPPAPPRDVFLSLQRHLLTTDDLTFVAERDGRVTAFAAALRRERSWHLASLFLLPEEQGRGLGGRLLDLIWDGELERRYTLTDAIQPVSNGMYARRGMIPTTPMLAFSGTARADAAAEVEPAEPDGAALAVLDRAAYGFDRRVDHELWGEWASLTLWTRAGEPVAYTYAWPHGRIGPIAGVDPGAAALAFRAELARLDGAAASVVAPGTSAAIVETALACGLRFQAPPGLLLLSRSTPAPTALAISSYTLL